MLMLDGIIIMIPSLIYVTLSTLFVKASLLSTAIVNYYYKKSLFLKLYLLQISTYIDTSSLVQPHKKNNFVSLC